MGNIVVIVVDTLRSRDIEEKKNLAPFLENKGKEGLKLENYYSNAPWTAPAHASMFTQKLPSSHDTNTLNPLFRGKNKLAKEMKQKGFRAVALSENNWFQPFSGFDKGFDEFKQYSSSSRVMEKKGGEVWEDIWKNDSTFEGSLDKYLYFWKKSLRKRDLKSVKAFFSHVSFKFSHSFSSDEADYNPKFTDKILNDGLDLLENNKDSFLFMNLMPVHAPYSFDKKQAERFLSDISNSKIQEVADNYTPEDHLRFDKEDEFYELREKSYQASVSYVDSKLKYFYESAPEDTIFVVLGDHGELIGEYDLEGSRLLGHQLGTFREQIDVPFYLFAKGKSLNLELDMEKLFDHRDLADLISCAVGDKRADLGRDYVNSEYFGNRALMDFVGADPVEELDEIMARKSFSVITNEFKLDIASDGKKAWSMETLSDKNQFILEDMPSFILSKADIMYSHYFD